MKLLDIILDFIFPSRCPCCGELNERCIPCEACAENIEEQRLIGKICKYCGNEKHYCECKKYHYLFSGVAAPFYNRDMAQNGVYMLKFSNAPYAAEYYGVQMAECFRERFPNVTVDLVCTVPSTKKDLRHKPYDKVYLLGKTCAKELEVPLNKNLIRKARQTEVQHDLSHNRRQQNVKGAFKVKKRLDGKTVLLIDDIKTTGYTLNECAKQLRMAGAEKVYCLTALITPKRSCKEKETNV